MKDAFYSSSYSSTTDKDVENTEKIAAKDIEDFNSMNKEQAVARLKKRFDITLDENGNVVYTMFCKIDDDKFKLP